MPKKNNRRARKSQIGNCPFPFKLAFECPEKWESLEPTDDSKVRYCQVCKLTVRMIGTEEEYNAAYEGNECVALEVVKKIGDPFRATMVGRPSVEDLEEFLELNRRREVLKKAPAHD